MLKEKIQPIEFIGLHAQRILLKEKISAALARVLQQGHFILGPEVQQLEQQLAAFTGAEEVITCANGTDALQLLLLAQQVGQGDAVFVPTFTFASTAEVVAQANATPIFVDSGPDSFNIDPHSLEQALATLDRKKWSPKGIIAVDLFGYPADYTALHAIAKQHNLWVIGDAAQSFGGAIQDKKVGTLTCMTATSFFPSKPLGCYGDGGAIFTMDKQISELIHSLRNHGCGAHRYDHIRIGLNSRLDTLQAAILIEKLALFPKEMRRKNELAHFYSAELQNYVQVPSPPSGITHAWGLYTIRCPQRDKLFHALQEHAIPANIYYRKPLHLQPAYQHFPRAAPHLQNAEKACNEALSLPLHAYLTDDQLDYIITEVKNDVSS